MVNPFAFFIAKKPFDYREPPIGRVIGPLSLEFLKPDANVTVIVDVKLSEHLSSCPRALSNPHHGHGIDTGPSQQ